MSFISQAVLSITLAVVVSAQAPTELTWKNFDEVANYVRLKPADEIYQTVTWLDTVLAGHQEAQKQDKPLLLWLYFGDPRANC
ncbi:hypothetical protein NT6N_22060 [Oceaniferula spumae]|uniref:Uncharacterized protein n=1 Tax=Oceaniferula spumae TaxID=2979115 RepID=A0AAT9FMD5_9BACT